MFLFRIVMITFVICVFTSINSAHALRLEVATDAPVWQKLGADIILYSHIASGGIGMLSGPVAILSPKGKPIHRFAGKLFFLSMFVCYAIGASVAPFLPAEQRVNTVAGVMALYLLVTSWLAATRRNPITGPIEYVGLTIALCILGAGLLFSYIAANHPSGTIDGSPRDALQIFIVVGAISVIGDLHVVIRRSITGTCRIIRHLWRMCMSLFIASASFLYGQERFLPDWLQGSFLQSILVFFPLIAILIWALIERVPKRFHKKFSFT